MLELLNLFDQLHELPEVLQFYELFLPIELMFLRMSARILHQHWKQYMHKLSCCMSNLFG